MRGDSIRCNVCSGRKGTNPGSKLEESVGTENMTSSSLFSAAEKERERTVDRQQHHATVYVKARRLGNSGAYLSQSASRVGDIG